MRADGIRSTVALLLVLALACGPASAPKPRAPETSHPPSAATSGATTLRAGTSGDYPPLSLWSADRPEGYGPALLDAFATSAKVDVAWTRFKWPELTHDLLAGQFDVAADGITVRPERSVAGRFTVPIAWGGAVLLLRRPAWLPAGATTAASLDRPGLRIAVNRGGHLERVTRAVFHAATIDAIPDNAGVRAALARGDADAAMTNTFEAPQWAEGLGIERIGPLTHDVTSLWLRADRSDLAEHLDEWLLQEEENGRLGALRRRALGEAGAAPSALPLDALLAATLERLALMPFVAAAKQVTAKNVTDTAQEDRVIATALEAVKKAADKRAASAPDAARSAAFFRIQIEAAKDVQQHSPPSATTSFALETELRPAIARITARMAFLIVRLPRGLTRAAVLARAKEVLAESGVDDRRIEELASALVSLSDLSDR